MELLKAALTSPADELELVKPRIFVATTASTGTSTNAADLAVSAFIPDTIVIDDANAVVKGTYAVGDGTISSLTTLTAPAGTFSRVCAGQTITATAGTGSIAGGTTVSSVSADGSTIVLSANGTNGTVTDIIVGNASFTLQAIAGKGSRFSASGTATVASRVITGSPQQFKEFKPGQVIERGIKVGSGTISTLTTLTGVAGQFSRARVGMSILGIAGTGSIAGSTTITAVSADGSTITLSANGTNGTVSGIEIWTGVATFAAGTMITSVSADKSTLTISDAPTTAGLVGELAAYDYVPNVAFLNVGIGQSAAAVAGTGAVAGGATVSAISPDGSTIRLSATSTAGTVGALTFGSDTVVKFSKERKYASATLSLANAVTMGLVQVGDKITVNANGGSNQSSYNIANSGKDGRATIRAVDPTNNRVYFDLPAEPADSTAATGSIRVHIPFTHATLIGQKADGTANTGVVKFGYVNNASYQQLKLAAALAVPANTAPLGSVYPITARAGAKMELSQIWYQVATANDAIYIDIR